MKQRLGIAHALLGEGERRFRQGVLEPAERVVDGRAQVASLCDGSARDEAQGSEHRDEHEEESGERGQPARCAGRVEPVHQRQQHGRQQQGGEDRVEDDRRGEQDPAHHPHGRDHDQEGEAEPDRADEPGGKVRHLVSFASEVARRDRPARTELSSPPSSSAIVSR